jgi:hypothetical protein
MVRGKPLFWVHPRTAANAGEARSWPSHPKKAVLPNYARFAVFAGLSFPFTPYI